MKQFSLTFSMVKIGVNKAWLSLKDSIYVIDESLLSNSSIDILQTMHGGLTFLSHEFAQKLVQALQAG